MKNVLYDELVNLIGDEYAEKVIDCNLIDLIKEDDLKEEKFDFARDFFENVDFDNMEKYIEDGFNFFDVVKKFYDKELKMVSNLGAKLILNRKFGFDVKKKIAGIVNDFDENEYCERFFCLLDLISDDDEFFKCESCLKEIVYDDKLYENIVVNKERFWDAVNVVKYNLNKTKENLSFDNLVFIADVCVAIENDKQSDVKIWIKNIKSDEDCNLIKPVFISIVGCKKLTDDVLKKKISVHEAVMIYNKIKERVINDRLSRDSLNSAFSIVMNLQEDKNFCQEQLDNAIRLVGLIYDDKEFDEIKIFIRFLSVFDELPDLIKKNNFGLIEILPVMLKIYFAGGKIILKKNFSFDVIKKISLVLEKCNKSETRINNVLALIKKIDSDAKFYYCEKFLLRLAKDKELFFKSMEQVKNLYVRYFAISRVSNYVLKIVDQEKFSFEIVRRCERVILNRKNRERELICNLILKLKNDAEFIFAEKFLNDFDGNLNFDEKNFDLQDFIAGYYKKLLNVDEDSKDEIKILDNKNLSFNDLEDAIKFFANERDNFGAKKISSLICMIESSEEYKILRPFFKKLIENEDVYLSNQKVLDKFRKIIYDEADKFKIRKIFNNRFLYLECKIEAMNYLKEIDDDIARERLASLICVLKSNEIFDNIKLYFDKLKNVEKLMNDINCNLISPDYIVKIFELNLDEIWLENKISYDRLKKLIWYLAKITDEDKKNNIIKLIKLVKNNGEFDVIFGHIKDLLKNENIMSEIDNEKFDCDVICGIYKFKADKIFRNKNFSFFGFSALKKILEKASDFFRRMYIINIAYDMNNEADFIYIKEYLLMGKIDKNDKNYVAQASKFYVEKLSDKYGREYEDIKNSIVRLVSERKFSYGVLEQMADLLSRYKEKKERNVLFSKMISLKNDRDYVDNIEMVLDFSQEIKSDEKESFLARMRKAEQAANNTNSSGSNRGNNSNSPLIFSDGNLIFNLVNKNLILQFKDKKLVIMTTENFEQKNDVLKSEFIKFGIEINQEIDKHLYLFDGDEIKYFNEFKDYLNENGDSATIEDDQDQGITYCCLISPQNIEAILGVHKYFSEMKINESKDNNSDA